MTSHVHTRSVQRNKTLALHSPNSITGGAQAPKIETPEVNLASYRISDPLTSKEQSSRKATVAQACADLSFIQSEREGSIRKTMLEVFCLLVWVFVVLNTLDVETGVESLILKPK